MRKNRLVLVYHYTGGNAQFVVKDNVCLTLKANSDAHQSHNVLVIKKKIKSEGNNKADQFKWR